MSTHDAPLDRLVEEFNRDWQSGVRPDLGLFLRRVTGDQITLLAHRLVPLDIRYRQGAEEPVTAEHYREINEFCEKIARQELALSQTRTAQSAVAKSVTIGPYKLLQKLGEGGMGEVWMAEQEKPVRRRVALKLIKAGQDNRQIIARFEAERQALAMMNHANIAQVLDAGATADGLPFFVMELVQGIPFSKYCDQNKLSIDQRLRLFIPVCEAVQHAHQKGIIHRDLKPSNVLVCLYDGKPVAKVIDFGLAKALEQAQKLTDRTMFTEFGQVLGTLQYMSPEQAELNQLDVDTRTDIYSLGVMLYELLTGSTPIEADQFKKNAILQILATIREQEPQRPSVRLSSVTHEAASGISAQRQIEPAKLKSLLRGELDWIVMKALEKDRTRRYPTASGFAMDIQNFLAGDIVSARPPSSTYRFIKYVRRHRGLVASLASIMGLLIIGIIGLSWFWLLADAARREADRDRQVAINKTAEVAAEKHKVELERNRANEQAVRASEQERVANVRRGEAELATQEAFIARQLAEDERAKALQEATRAENALRETEATLARSNFFLAMSRWHEGRAREAKELLSKIPEQYRNFEWFYSQREFDGSDITLYSPNGTVGCIKFSPDGTRIVGGIWDDPSSIQIWSAENGEELQTIRGQKGMIYGVAVSHDGNRIVSGSSDGTLKVWDMFSGRLLTTCVGHSNAIRCVSFSVDGTRIVSGSDDTTLKLWDASTGQPLQTFSGHADQVTVLALNPDGTQLASISDTRELKFWDLETRSEIRSLEGPISDVAYSPDGNRMAICDLLGVDICDVRSGEKLRTIGLGSPSFSRLVRFSPDGNSLVSFGDNGLLRLWDTHSGELLRSLPGHFEPVSDAAFSPDGSRLVSASSDRMLKIWDVGAGNEDSTLAEGKGAISELKISADGNRVLAINDDFVSWDLATRQKIPTVHKIKGPIKIASVSPVGDRVVWSPGGNRLTVQDLSSGIDFVNYEGHTVEVACVAFNHDGTQIASGDDGGTIRLWNAESGQTTGILSGHSAKITKLLFSPDGKQIVSISDDLSLKIWDAKTTTELLTLAGDDLGKNIAAVSPDGTKLVTDGAENQMTIWDMATGQEIHTLVGHSSTVECVAFNSDGTRIVSGSSDRTLKLWDTATGEELRSISGDLGQVFAVCFSPDGKTIVTSCNNRGISLFEASAVPTLKLLKGHQNYILGVTYSPDGSLIASGGMDKTIRIWNSESGNLIRTLRGHRSHIAKFAFSPDGTGIASWGWDNFVKLWDVGTGEELQSFPTLATEGMVTVAFSADGAVIVARDSIGKQFGWKIGSGESIADLEITPASGPALYSPDGRCLVIPIATDVGLVDLSVARQPQEQQRRRRLAGIKVSWHQEQAESAGSEQQWYAAMIHYAWLLKSMPADAWWWIRLHESYQRWLESLGGRPVPQLPLVVKQMMLLPRGEVISVHYRDDLNQNIWALAVPREPGDLDDEGELAHLVEIFRRAVQQHPHGSVFNTLGVAELRLGNYPEAIAASSKALELSPRDMNLPGPYPIDLAVIAISHLKLGNQETAQQYLVQFEQAMTNDIFSNDKECLQFARELKSLFVEDKFSDKSANNYLD